ncbi:MAG: glycoside hydrolase family 88 protein [Bacteroidales bacterium]
MKSLPLLLFPALLLALSCSSQRGERTREAPDPDRLAAQLDVLETELQAAGFPRSLTAEGELHAVPAGDWTSGFYAGTLWYMYEYTGDEKWKERALRYTLDLEEEQYNTGDHDMGFRMYCSYGNALRLTGEEAHIPVLLQSARSLITRYDSTVGCIRSWDFTRGTWQYPVIIDNMMNLELLFWASEQSGDPRFRDIALHHARTTLANHFRPDYSSVHVVDYDSLTGAVRQKNTHQGYADGSAWARGQSWGLYGYTMAYRCTGEEAFLVQAEHIAGYLLGRLPEDEVPYWDYDAPGIPDEPRDVSAAAILASALYELSTFSENGPTYLRRADGIMESLERTYASAPGENRGFLLGHSVGSKPENGEVDMPIVYADYYYLEAILRRKNLSE